MEKNNYLKLPSGTLILHKFKTGEKYQKYVKVLNPKLTKLIKLWLKITLLPKITEVPLLVVLKIHLVKHLV